MIHKKTDKEYIKHHYSLFEFLSIKRIFGGLTNELAACRGQY